MPITQRTLSLKDLIIINKDNLRPLQSVRIPTVTRQRSNQSRVYSKDHNGGLRSILHKIVSDSGTIKYTVKWKNGQRTTARPCNLRNFYTIVEEYELEQFNKKDTQRRSPSPLMMKLMRGYRSDSTDDEDYVSEPAPRQPRRVTRKLSSSGMGTLDRTSLSDNSSVGQCAFDENHRRGSYSSAPIVIPESSPTPSPYSSPHQFTT